MLRSTVGRMFFSSNSVSAGIGSCRERAVGRPASAWRSTWVQLFAKTARFWPSSRLKVTRRTIHVMTSPAAGK
jgi:hypothetical protein